MKRVTPPSPRRVFNDRDGHRFDFPRLAVRDDASRDSRASFGDGSLDHSAGRP